MRTKLRIFLFLLLMLFLSMNVVSYFHAYQFTHFSKNNTYKTGSASRLTFGEKLITVLAGVNTPKPKNTIQPHQPYEVVKINSNKRLECWYVKKANALDTILLFHGYGSNKSALVDQAEEFYLMGYSTLMVDFMGSGGSEGYRTTIGYFEAEEVRSCVNYIRNKGEENIILFGSSMGAVSILRAVGELNVSPNAIIIECPFGNMYTTVKTRFEIMKIPNFPLAGMLTFWGGVQNNFWAFDHNPIDYAKGVSCPTLLMYGEKDPKVSREEIDAIFLNINGEKLLKTFALAGHENYLHHSKQEWIDEVTTFLYSLQNNPKAETKLVH